MTSRPRWRAVLDALTRRFGADYRVLPYLAPSTALDGIRGIMNDREEIALVIADQWMPEMTTGSSSFTRVRSLEPSAKRALLVAWGDHEASRRSFRDARWVSYDNYLYKPWTPAEVHLYPLISKFLAEWTQVHRAGMELINIVGDEGSPRSESNPRVA